MTQTHEAGGPTGSPRRIPRWGWIAAAAALLALAAAIAVGVGDAGHPAALSYSTFLDQVDAGNVAAVTFRGTEIDGRLIHPADASADDFTSRAPDFGDPSLIPLLRQRHVAIDVATPSSWTWLLERVPWPMLAFLGVMLVAALVRIVRGSRGRTGSATPGLPQGGGMMGLIAALAARRHGGGEASPRDGDGDKPPPS